MSTQPAGRAPTPVTAATSPAARTARPVGQFAARAGRHVRCHVPGGTALSFAAFAAARWLGFPGLAQHVPGLSALIIAVCLAVPMAACMAVRGHGRRHNLEMTGSTIVDWGDA